ncbi:MAG: FAD-binding oxidoreductase [Betaproteobacteria bacterium]|nr:FAD-binding oxidoreductase [Betaproteobacteria bacterium]
MATIRTCTSEACSLPESAISSLATAMRGRLIQPEDAGYDAARQVWNATIDRRPALIARCHDTADVIAAVKFASTNALLVSVRGGGHNIAGSALCDDGLTIDLSAMRGIRADAGQRRAWVQGGALLGDVDHETQAYGLAVPLGINSTTGVGGLALGGGFGWLSRAFGHTVDNVISADVVTAAGDLVRASASENTDLYWAIRGGSGNFGIVTAFEFRLHPVGPTILSGPVVHPLDHAPAVLRAYRQVARELRDEASCWFVLRKAPPLPFLKPEHHGAPVLILAMAYAGAVEQGEAALRPLREIGTPLADAVSPHPYAAWQAAFDPLLAPGARNYWKSNDFAELRDEVLDLMVAATRNLPENECEIFVAQLGGAAGRVAGDATAYAHRQTRYTMNIHGRWQSPSGDEKVTAWVRDLYARSAPLSTGSVYVNFVPEAGEVRTVGPFGANEARLRRIKSVFDPLNLFRANVPIEPLRTSAAA